MKKDEKNYNFLLFLLLIVGGKMLMYCGSGFECNRNNFNGTCNGINFHTAIISINIFFLSYFLREYLFLLLPCLLLIDMWLALILWRECLQQKIH